MPTDMTTPAFPGHDRGDLVIAIAGDWHGNGRWAVTKLKQLGDAGVTTVLHVGDFGLFRTAWSKNYLDDIEHLAAKSGIVILISDGNHEDHHWRIELETANPGQPAAVRPHIWLLPRGYRWTQHGRSFVALGGAPSIDFYRRTAGRDWWLEETIAEADIERTIAGGPADIMIGHDAPAPATAKVDRIRNTNPLGWPAEALAYAARGTHAITRAYDAVRPRLYFHGHYHVRDQATLPDGRSIHSLHQDGSHGNVVLLDLVDLTVTDLPWAGSPTRAPRALTWREMFETPID